MAGEYAGPERRSGNQRRLLWLVIGVLVLSLVVGVTVNIGLAIGLSRVKANTNAIRDAGYETCVRGNGPIAEQQFRAGLTPPEAIARLVKQLGLPADIAEQTSVEALRKRLPIFDCTPLLRNKPARVMSGPEQQRYVDEFARGKVPLPPP